MQTKILYAVLLAFTAATTALATVLPAGKSGKECCHQRRHYQQPERDQNIAGKRNSKDRCTDYPFIPPVYTLIIHH